MLRSILIILFFMFSAGTGFADSAPSGNIITKIEITGNRIDESIIRMNLAFHEGDAVDEAKIAKSRANLYSLGIFKKLDISEQKDEITGGTKIIIDARDGWYLLPVPMFGSNGGERYFGGAILEQNALKKGERISAFASFQDSLSRYSLSTQFNKVTFSAALERNTFTQYQYQDGAYNSQIITEKNIGTLANYGQIVNSYDQDETTLRFSASRQLSERFKGNLGVSFNDVQYSNGTVSTPNDTGRINVLHIGLQYGKFGPGRDVAAIIGRLFGLGMADLQENFKPLLCTTVDYGCQTSLDGSIKAFGSDSEFSKISLSGSRVINYTDRSRWSVSMKAGYGVNLPDSQLFVTDRSAGLLGVYAREFRGDKIVTANTAYHRSLLRNSHGQLNGEVFCEYSECFFDNPQVSSREGAKEGVGFNLNFQFWRFPLPLGLGYTYSIDDKDWKISAAFGGLF